MLNLAEMKNKVVGLPFEEAHKIAQEAGLKCRIHGRIGTCDFRRDRINVSVDANNIVTDIVKVG
jgi:hypothetical protein